MKKWLLLLMLLTPSVVRAELVTPKFTQGSMNSTTTTTQEIVEEITTKNMFRPYPNINDIPN